MADCGFRRGSDAFKGLAFGATLVGLGRPILYGLAANKSEGVKEVIQQMTEELERLMSMTDFTSPGELGRDSPIEY